MLTINTSVNAEIGVHAESQSPVSVDQHPLVSSEFGEKADQLPRGTAMHAARSPHAKTPHKDNARTTPLSRQPTTNSGNEDAATDGASTNSRKSADLARVAARRVNIWKKSEQERRGEEERAKQMKVDQDKRRQSQAVQAKQRRRAEIYALNALLRELQQEKIANFIAAQKQLEGGQVPKGCREEALTVEHVALAQVRAVGV